MTIGEGIFYSTVAIFCGLPAGVALLVVLGNFREIFIEPRAKKKQK